jgi:hypothetical protein
LREGVPPMAIGMAVVGSVVVLMLLNMFPSEEIRGSRSGV